MFNINPTKLIQLLIVFTYVGLITLLPSIQFMPKYIIWFQDRQRLLELLLIIFVLIYSFLNKKIAKNIIHVNPKLRYLLFILLLLSIVSSLLAISPRHAFIEISVFAGLCYLSIYVAEQFLNDKEIFSKRVIYVLWASVVLYMVSFYSGYITATIFKTPLTWPFPFTGFSNIRAFNQYQLWSIGILSLPLLTFRLNNYRSHTFLHAGLTLWWVLLFYSASRGVLVAWFIGALITLAIYRKLAWPFLKLQFFQLTTGYIAYYVLFKTIPTTLHSSIVTNTVIRETTNDRLALWNLAFTLVKNFPFFGAGPMGYAWYSQTNGHPHNSFLQLASEWGLFATLIILTITGYGVYHWLKKLNPSRLATQSKLTNHLTIILFFTIITNAAYSLVDGVIVMPISQVLMFTMIGLMIGLYLSNDKVTTSKDSRFRPVFAWVVLFTMIWSTYPEIARGLSGNEKGFSMGYSAIGPRFWREVK
jgi:putative inorganic carbon (hco3(-)) transporter